MFMLKIAAIKDCDHLDLNFNKVLLFRLRLTRVMDLQAVTRKKIKMSHKISNNKQFKFKENALFEALQINFLF